MIHMIVLLIVVLLLIMIHEFRQTIYKTVGGHHLSIFLSYQSFEDKNQQLFLHFQLILFLKFSLVLRFKINFHISSIQDPVHQGFDFDYC